MEFFIKDKSGRGDNNTLSYTDFSGFYAHEDDQNWDGVQAVEWAEDAEIGAHGKIVLY